MSLLPDSTFETQQLNQALEEFLEAKADHDRAYDEYVQSGGYSWGYRGYDYIERVEKAATEYQNRLKKVIRESVKEVLQELGYETKKDQTT